MAGIVAYGAYVPYWRLQRAAIGAALGSGGGKGTRAVASYDEDATSMGVEAARIAMKAANGIAPAGRRSSPPLDPPISTRRTRRRSTRRSVSTRRRPARTTWRVGAIGDRRTAARATRRRRRCSPCSPTCAPAFPAAPTSATAATRGAPSCSPAPCTTVRRSPSSSACGAATDEFLDRWRVPGEEASHVWEERFGEHAVRAARRDRRSTTP